MNYFLISNMWPNLDNPGYGSFVKNVVRGLNSNNISCYCSALIKGRPKSGWDKLIKYLIFYLKIIGGYFRKYDFIYLHFPNQSLPILIPLYLLQRKTIIINLHGEDLLYSNRGVSYLLGRLNDWFMGKVDAIVVPSLYYKYSVLNRIKCTKNKIIVSPSGGVNLQFFKPLHKTYDVDEIRLGYVGRIDKGKGWFEFVEMIKKLPSNVNYKATIIGSGYQVGELHKIMYHFGNRINYISSVPHDKLNYYYSRFDLLIFPSSRKSESLGLVGIEAMACGTPVVGFNVGGISSYLIDGYNGYLISVGDIEGLVAAVLKFKNLSNAERQTISKNCVMTSKMYSSKYVLDKLSVDIKHIINYE